MKTFFTVTIVTGGIKGLIQTICSTTLIWEQNKQPFESLNHSHKPIHKIFYCDLFKTLIH